MMFNTQTLRFPLNHGLVPAVLLAGLMLSGALPAQTFTVNSTGHAADAALNGQCATGNQIGGQPECTLRAALQEADHAGPATVNIHFNIADCPDDLCVIEIDTLDGQSLPLITSPVVLDGSTQPGNADVCQVDIGDRPPYRIALHGSGGAGSHGLHLATGSDDSVIRGLNIRNFERGIMLVGSHDNHIECNAIGTDSTGMVPGPGNEMAGVFLACDSSGNVIGGAEPWQANLIAANGIDGVQIFGGYTSCGGDQPEDNMPINNAVLGNQIGIAADGTSPLGNLLAGIAIFGGPGADHNLIGVLQDRETIRGNVIGCNGTAGLYIDSDGLQTTPTENTVVQGNYFGTDRTGLVDLGNTLAGIDIIRGALTLIGGPNTGDANVFAFNGNGGNDDGGIYMERQMSERNRIQRNIIYANQGKGIILRDGHEFDPEGTGPNNLQAAPAMSSTFKHEGIVSITYSVPDQEDNFPLVIEFFLADGNLEQGRLFLIDHGYPAAGSSTLTFSSTQIDAGQYLVATATDSLGNTSEFSAVSLVLGEVPIEDDRIFYDRFQ
jgi:trimeric autotransporter adhesin